MNCDLCVDATYCTARVRGALHLGASPGTLRDPSVRTRNRSLRRHARRLKPTPTTEMSATEMLRTQFDALQVECNGLQAENRMLQEERPDQAHAVDLERELAETREENVRLSQEVIRLEATRHKAESEAEGCMDELWGSVGALNRDAADARERLVEIQGLLVESQEEVETGRIRTAEAESYCREMENEQDRLRADVELQTVRAVARETKKGEEREARLVKRIEELERGAVVESGTRSHTGAGGGWE